MNWRTIIKNHFADLVKQALGDDLKLWGAWNNQINQADKEDTYGSLAVFFEYQSIGKGLEYLKQRTLQRADRIPVTVTLHLVFDDFTEQQQDLAYEYANAVTAKIHGLKHPCVHGQFVKSTEVEDINHEVKYDYQLSFDMQIKEAYSTQIQYTDANPETETNPNPKTGRRLKLRFEPLEIKNPI